MLSKGLLQGRGCTKWEGGRALRRRAPCRGYVPLEVLQQAIAAADAGGKGGYAGHRGKQGASTVTARAEPVAVTAAAPGKGRHAGDMLPDPGIRVLFSQRAAAVKAVARLAEKPGRRNKQTKSGHIAPVPTAAAAAAVAGVAANQAATSAIHQHMIVLGDGAGGLAKGGAAAVDMIPGLSTVYDPGLESLPSSKAVMSSLASAAPRISGAHFKQLIAQLLQQQGAGDGVQAGAKGRAQQQEHMQQQREAPAVLQECGRFLRQERVAEEVVKLEQQQQYEGGTLQEKEKVPAAQLLLRQRGHSKRQMVAKGVKQEQEQREELSLQDNSELTAKQPLKGSCHSKQKTMATGVEQEQEQQEEGSLQDKREMPEEQPFKRQCYSTQGQNVNAQQQQQQQQQASVQQGQDGKQQVQEMAMSAERLQQQQGLKEQQEPGDQGEQQEHQQQQLDKQGREQGAQGGGPADRQAGNAPLGRGSKRCIGFVGWPDQTGGKRHRAGQDVIEGSGAGNGGDVAHGSSDAAQTATAEATAAEASGGTALLGVDKGGSGGSGASDDSSSHGTATDDIKGTADAACHLVVAVTGMARSSAMPRQRGGEGTLSGQAAAASARGSPAGRNGAMDEKGTGVMVTAGQGEVEAAAAAAAAVAAQGVEAVAGIGSVYGLRPALREGAATAAEVAAEMESLAAMLYVHLG